MLDTTLPATSDRPAIVLPSGKLLLNGELTEPRHAEGTIDAIDPATGERIMAFPACSAADVDEAVKAAHTCFESREWRAMRPLDRGRLLENLALLVEEKREELAALESLDSGKLLFVTRNIDLQFTIDGLRYFAGWASKINGEYVTHNPLMRRSRPQVYAKIGATQVEGDLPETSGN